MRESPDTGLVQTAATIAGIALALSALLESRNPKVDGHAYFQAGLLFAGFFAVLASLLLVRDLRAAFHALSQDGPPQGFGFIEASIYTTGLVYIGFLINNAR